MTDHPGIPAGLILLAEVATGGVVAHTLSAIPPWLGGACSALFVGVVLRLLDPSLRRIGERFASRRSSPPPPPAPKEPSC